MGVRACVRMGLAVLACASLSACASNTNGGVDCVSYYDHVASAPTWAGLKDAMLGHTEWGRVVSVRTQARGDDVGAGDRDAVRVVDLLNRNGRRLVQVDVWRNDAEVVVVGGTAVLYAEVTDVVLSTQDEPETFRMPMTQVWVRKDDGWKCIAGHAGPRRSYAR